MPTYFTFLLFAFFGKLLETLAKFSWGQRALSAYPRVFSYGLFSREGPNEQQLAQTSFQMRFIGHGYSQGGVSSLIIDCVTVLPALSVPPVLSVLPMLSVPSVLPFLSVLLLLLYRKLLSQELTGLSC